MRHVFVLNKLDITPGFFEIKAKLKGLVSQWIIICNHYSSGRELGHHLLACQTWREVFLGAGVTGGFLAKVADIRIEAHFEEGIWEELVICG
jgi:hypothetical protein